ncbi:MAG: hypothetical protein QOF67_3218 [Mycobacterium sp.]|nr:hypothetical protein [Mycobacterium sp.]
MGHLGGDAAVLGAFGPMPGVVNDGAMTVLEPRNTLAAFTAHGSFIARADAKAPISAACRGTLRLAQLAPTQFVQAVVVDAEVVGDFVDHRDRDLVDDL